MGTTRLSGGRMFSSARRLRTRMSIPALILQDVSRVFNAGPSGDGGHGRPCGRCGAVWHDGRSVVQRGHPRRGRNPRSVDRA